MGFLQFLDKLLHTSKPPAKQIVSDTRAYFEDPTGYYIVRGDEFHKVYSEWINTKTVSDACVANLGPQAFIVNPGNRSGYVREFCLRALALHDGTEAFKPVLQRLNDYVPSNRERALHLTLKWLAELPLVLVVDAMPEIAALTQQSRTDTASVQAALEQRLRSDAGHEAMISGLMHKRAMVRRACWVRCLRTLAWSGPERMRVAIQCGDPAIARSVETDVFALSDNDLMEWFRALKQVRPMPLRRAFLVAMRRRGLMDSQEMISLALWDDSFSIRWLGRHWGKDDAKNLVRLCADQLGSDSTARHKRYALEGLAELKIPEGLEACKSVLHDANPGIRKAALVTACAIEADNQSVYVAEALQDTDLLVVREGLKQLSRLSLAVPVDAISKAAKTRRAEFSFFEMLLLCAREFSIWPALHLASFTSLAAPSLQLKLAPAIGDFLRGIDVAEVYVAPNQKQWQAICGWMPMDTLGANSGLRQVLDFHAAQMKG